MAMVSLLPAVQATAEPTGLVFNVKLDPALVGGAWMLSTHTGADQLQSVVLGKGDVPADGRVSLNLLPADVVGVTTSNMFFFRALRPIDDHSAHYSSASAGLLAEEVERGTVLDLPGSAVTIVPLYDSLEALKAAIASDAEPDTAPAPVPTVPVESTPAEFPSLFRVSPTDLPPAPVVEDPLAAGPAFVAMEPPADGTSASTAASTTSTGNCSVRYSVYPIVMEDCIVDARDYYGIRAMRGYSHRAYGMRNVFEVESQNEQKWQNARRVSAGPFQADGTTTRRNALIQTDTWPREGDCWAGDTTVDYGGVPCAPMGQRVRNGNDTWRLERHALHWYGGIFRTEKYQVEDRLFEKSYDGGMREDWIDTHLTSNYYRDPRAVARGEYGSWSRYPPGSSSKTTLEKSKAIAGGATINIASSQGGGSFTSTFENATTKKVVNRPEFVTSAGFTQPQENGTVGHWYRYDFRSGWEFEAWSCIFAYGWADPIPQGKGCWEGIKVTP